MLEVNYKKYNRYFLFFMGFNLRLFISINLF